VSIADADDDQQRGSAEVERHVHALGHESRQRGIQPFPDERNGRHPESIQQELREDRDERQVRRRPASVILARIVSMYSAVRLPGRMPERIAVLPMFSATIID